MEKTTLEVIAPTIDEAIEKGLGQLGLQREMVDIEVLDNGAKGLFGLGGRQARVRLSIHHDGSTTNENQTEVNVSEKVGIPAEMKMELAEGEDPQPLEIASQVVTELLVKMKVRAQISCRYIPASGDEDEEPIALVDIQGDDLSILIGRRSEVLNALQYITSLIVSKQLGRWVPLLIDVQGYRTRRERQLRQLARRMADQAIQSGRRQVLEPMSASERRLIHLELREHPQVTTESVGEEPNRKVTILPRT